MTSSAAVAVPNGTDDARPAVSGTDWVSAAPFLLIHLAPFAVFISGFGLGDLLLAVILYASRMFFITAGYHRYFSHRSYVLPRGVQFVMAAGASTAAQKGPLWWTSHHRMHHRGADTTRDVHSPRDGLLWSHIGWILSNRYKKANEDFVTDLAKYPELRMLDRFHLLGPLTLVGVCWWIAGWPGVIAFAISTVALWHATFSVNSIAHRFGRRRYETRDASRNSWLIAILTLGEGWHNNHHHYPHAVRQGHKWWEIDCTWYAIRLLALVGIARNLCDIPPRALAARPARS